MKKPLLKFLSAVAAVGLAASGYSLTIVPTFDSSITSDVNGPAMMSAINYAISVLQSNFTDNVTVKINFVSDESVGLGQSSTWGNDYSYSTFLTALRSKATSVNDANGLSKIPNSTTDPLTSQSTIYLNLAPARLLGLDTGYGSDGFDSTVSFKMSLINFTRPPGNSNKYDLAQVAEHEMDEVLGCSSDLGYPEISPIDLFRYTSNLVRTYVTTGDDAYFSVDGTNLLARFNMHAGGDYSDWYSYNGNWAPPGITPHPQVQDAYALPDYAFDVGSNELAMLDVVGWTLAVAPSQSPPIVKMVRSGANQFTLSWPSTATGFVLQERTNLVSGAWLASASGSANPAVLLSTNTRKFYRLYKAATPSAPLAHGTAVNPSATPAQLRIHITRPSQP